ncbi:MAG TPA: PAS domain S-box protein [Candidatus Krumholzibacteria bacterium]
MRRTATTASTAGIVAVRPPGALHDVLAALGAVSAMLILRWLLKPFLGDHVPYLTFFGAVAFAAWLGRWKSATIAAALGFLAANYFIVEPSFTFHFNRSVVVELLGYALSCGLIIYFAEAMYRVKDRADLEANDRAAVEESERRQKEMLRVTLASIGDGVIVTDPNGRVRFMNPEAERLTEWRQYEAAGRPLTDVFQIVAEGTDEPAENPVDRVNRLGTVVGFAAPTEVVSKSGRRTPIADSSAPIRENAGPLLGVVVVFRDVARQRAAERDQAQLAAIVQFSGEAVATKDLNGIVQTWNASAEKLFGYTAAEIVGRPITMLLPPDRLHEENDILNRLRMGRPVERFETIRVTKDGRHIPVSVSISPIRDGNGRVIGASKVVHDISEVVAARAALEQEHELLSTTLASIGDAVITTDAVGRVTYINPVAESVLGWPLDDALGEPVEKVFRIVSEDTREKVENPVKQALRDGAVVALGNHTLLVRKDGGERMIDDTAAPIRNREGEQIGCVLVFRDISERRLESRRAENEIERLLVNERRARAEVELTNRMKDEFLATLSHELRTPLNAILGFSQLIGKNPSDARCVREGIAVITRNAKIQVDLISDLLDMSRIISGKLRLDVREVNLAEIVNAGIDAIRHSAETKGIIIDTDLTREPVVAHGDSGRLQQVVWNLLSNAVKFTPRRGRIRVLLRSDHSTAKIVVEDSGIGIRPDVLPHLFERFRQADSSSAREHGGLGIGLAIVKHLVELHGGSVYAASGGENKGSIFTVELPLVTEPTAPRTDDGAAQPGLAPEPIEEDNVDLSGLTVLAIDDQEDSRSFLARVLESRGARVLNAASAEEGLYALKKHHPAIVLCDIGMPGVDGYQFIRELRESGDHTPALAVTAFARAEDRLRALRAGYQGHISKPVSPAELFATILVFVGQRK